MSEVQQYQSSKQEGVVLTSSAKAHVLSYLSKNPAYKGIRLSVKKTGCSGYSYVVDFVSDITEGDMIFSLEQNYSLFIDKQSYPLLKGMTMDYVKQGINHKLIFQNPNQTGQCGCGESFTVS